MDPNAAQNQSQPANQSPPPQVPNTAQVQKGFTSRLKSPRLIFILLLLIIIALGAGYFVSSSVVHQPKTYNIKKNDLDNTINLGKEDTVSINLNTSPGLILNTQVSNPSIVDVKEGYDEKTGKFIAKITPKKKGEVDIAVSGSPSCGKGEVCIPLVVTILRNHYVFK